MHKCITLYHCTSGASTPGDAAQPAQQACGHTGDRLQLTVDDDHQLDNDLVTLAMTGWAEAKLRQLQMLSREYKTFYLAEVPVGQPRARELSLQKQGYLPKLHLQLNASERCQLCQNGTVLLQLPPQLQQHQHK